MLLGLDENSKNNSKKKEKLKIVFEMNENYGKCEINCAICLFHTILLVYVIKYFIDINNFL